jgi:acyl-CoA reductase-like NAD-dependent aldehyde dehydrogenase
MIYVNDQSVNNLADAPFGGIGQSAMAPASAAR